MNISLKRMITESKGSNPFTPMGVMCEVNKDPHLRHQNIRKVVWYIWEIPYLPIQKC